MDIIFNVTHYDRNIIRDQIRGEAYRTVKASLQKDENEEVNDGSKPFNMDLEPIII